MSAPLVFENMSVVLGSSRAPPAAWSVQVAVRLPRAVVASSAGAPATLLLTGANAPNESP